MLWVVSLRCFVNASPSISASDGVYVAVRLSYDFVPEFEVVVRLTGEWPTGDKLLLGGLLSSYDVMKPLNFKATSALEGTQLVSGLWFSQGSQRVHDGTATLWTTGANVLPQRNSGSRWGCRSTPQGALFIGYSRRLGSPDEGSDVAGSSSSASSASRVFGSRVAIAAASESRIRQRCDC